MDNGAEVIETIDAMIAKLKSISEDTPKELAAKAVPLVKAEITRSIAAGNDPSGVAWKKTKEGNTPLRNAADSLSVNSVGNVVIVRLDNHHAKHHFGIVKGGIRRQVIPTREIPDPIVRALKELANLEIARKLS